ncbi:MAG: FtsX-like permease family protein [Pseudohongiella sp.]|nr:FtsX-like permease family protein [Pseudohongiella sp.]
MEIGPIYRALMRNRLGVILIAAQIAFTLTVIVNAVYIINDRGELMARPSGTDEANLFFINNIGYGDTYNEAVVSAEDLDMIRQLPGVTAATIINAIPVSGSGSSTGMATVAGRIEGVVPTAVYTVDEQALSTLGVELVAGRDFTATDVRYRNDSIARGDNEIIITVAMAEALFPGEGMQAVGRTIYDVNQNASVIIGLVARLQAPWPQSSFVENSMLIAEVYIDNSAIYLVRTEPGQRDRLMVEVEERLAASGHSRILRNNRSLEERRAESYRIDSAMSTILVAVIGTLMFITAMGIVGLAVFSINRRRKQIGTRRALGATRPDILRYFLLENLLISTAGVVAGAVLAIAFNLFLVQNFDMSRIDWYYAPAGMVVLLILGQLAVIGPAISATRISPALATRSI